MNLISNGDLTIWDLYTLTLQNFSDMLQHKLHYNNLNISYLKNNWSVGELYFSLC